ncbi:hypothetical protein [Candidatus Thiosymbion oneisti]|uniref:hypothetical protein n=1 Tax=Candidatus Thiosymbion oneisti TaxID=589554 RepID=UPI000AF5BD81|nr:hypothetical protein [Candidatus Thiosymbion oneisti]
MIYPIIQIPDDAGEKVEQQGTKRKFWYAGDTLLFKEGRPGTGENWAEKVACEICALLEIPHAHYEFATSQGREGVVTKSFLPAGCEYVTANAILSRLKPAYKDQRLYQARQHTVRVFLALGANSPFGFPVELPVGYAAPSSIGRADDLMVGYLVLDALIGNSDRHDENWGFISCGGSPSHVMLAPTFDHASSLGWNETDENRLKRLMTQDRGGSVEAYATRALRVFRDPHGTSDHDHPGCLHGGCKDASGGCLLLAQSAVRPEHVGLRVHLCAGALTPDHDTGKRFCLTDVGGQ